MYTFRPECCSLDLRRAASAGKIATEALLLEGEESLGKVIAMLAAALAGRVAAPDCCGCERSRFCLPA
jgi:hypothetical protein